MLDFRRLSEEQAKAARQADAVDKEFAEAMRALLKVPSFQTYRTKLLSLVTKRGEDLLESVKGIDGVLIQEFEKGTMRGLLLAANLPEAMLSQWDAGKSEPDEAES